VPFGAKCQVLRPNLARIWQVCADLLWLIQKAAPYCAS